MQIAIYLTLLFANLAWCSTTLSRSTLNGGCTGAGGAPGVCISTASCKKGGGSYISNACPGTPDDIKCCTKPACGSGGNCRFTSQCSGTTISNVCPGPSNFKCCEPKTTSSGGGGGSSVVGGPISRTEIISRGQYWITNKVPYNQDADHRDPEGTLYRTDCSGFVSMALHASHPGLTTLSLVPVSREISWGELLPGDYVGTLGSSVPSDNRHVTLFLSWVDASKKEYHSLECRGRQWGCIPYTRPVGWEDGGHASKPYRYIHVE